MESPLIIRLPIPQITFMIIISHLTPDSKESNMISRQTNRAQSSSTPSARHPITIFLLLPAQMSIWCKVWLTAQKSQNRHEISEGFYHSSQLSFHDYNCCAPN